MSNDEKPIYIEVPVLFSEQEYRDLSKLDVADGQFLEVAKHFTVQGEVRKAMGLEMVPAGLSDDELPSDVVDEDFEAWVEEGDKQRIYMEEAAYLEMHTTDGEAA